jgi:hypothetical protein
MSFKMCSVWLLTSFVYEDFTSTRNKKETKRITLSIFVPRKNELDFNSFGIHITTILTFHIYFKITT